jgi:hypothetical protein
VLAAGGYLLRRTRPAAGLAALRALLEMGA